MATASKPLRKANLAEPAGKKLLATNAGRAAASLSASKAKTHLLELLDTVDRDRKPITITKRGRPVATLVPIPATAPGSIFGCMKGTGRITGDVVGPEPDAWHAMVE